MMKAVGWCRAVLMAAALVISAPSWGVAQSGFEIGTSLAGANIGLGDNDITTFSIPASNGFGFVNPGVYASIFVVPRFAIEPQVSLIVVSESGHTNHLLSFGGQADYFVHGTSGSSPYVFGTAGVVDVSGSGTTPTFFGAGAGYRILKTASLAFRIDGRFMHFTDNGGDLLSFTLSIGGVFGRR